MMLRVALAVICVVIIGGGALLFAPPVPAPTAKVEKVIPNDQLLK